MKKIILSLAFICTVFVTTSFASNNKQYYEYLGKFGIELQENNDYSKYIGKEVVYIERPIDAFNYNQYSVFTIKKIVAKEKKMTITLIDNNSQKSCKMEASIGRVKTFWGNYKEPFLIDYSVTVPLLLLDEFNALKKEYLGKEYKGESGTIFKITEINYEPKFKVGYKNMTNNNYNEISPFRLEKLQLLGKKYTHPKVKGFFEIVEIRENENVGLSYSDFNPHPRLHNVEVYNLAFAGEECFKKFLSTDYITSLSQVEKPENSKIRYGKTQIIKDSTITKYSYVDNVIDITIFATNRDFHFTIRNNYTSTIKIIWDEAAFIDLEDTSSKIMHSGIKFSQMEESQPASVIIKGAKLEEVVCPINKVYYSDILKTWNKGLLYNGTGFIKLMLPIQIKDVVNEYVFVFKVKKVYQYPSFIKDEFLEIEQ